MNTETIQALRQLNERFYSENHESFSNTRQRPWRGWERVAAAIGRLDAQKRAQLDADEGLGAQTAMRVLDVGCGNMRFERYLLEALPNTCFDFSCVDACEQFAHGDVRASFRELDVVEHLVGSESLSEALGSSYDVVAAFGLMHHIPSSDLREKLVGQLARCVKPRGMLVISFWQFAQDPKSLRRAESATEAAQATMGLALDEGDYLLGWNAKPGTYRYCHSFSDEEIDGIVGRYHVAERYSEDKNNAYVIIHGVADR